MPQKKWKRQKLDSYSRYWDLIYWTAKGTLEYPKQTDNRKYGARLANTSEELVRSPDTNGHDRLSNTA